MTLTAAQKKSIEEVLNALINATGRPPRKRELAGMFLDLVDREDWPEYYEVIPEPRCLNGVKTTLEKNRYKDPLDAYTDLSLVFLNALFYNEPDSQISKDAQTLKKLLDSEWKSKPLPTPRDSPPPTSPQKVHEPEPPKPKPAPPAAASKPIAPAPAPAAPIASGSTMPPPAVPAPVEPPEPEYSESETESSDDEEDDAYEDPLDGAQDLDIIRQLERGLPRYAPLLGPEGGWMADVKHERHLEIVQAIKAYRDEDNIKLSTALDGVPEDKLAISWRLLESRSRSKTYYASSRPFDADIARILVGGVPSLAGEAWTRVVALQRVAHAFTSPHAPALPLAQPLTLDPPLDAPGPHALESITHKGLVFRARDYVHVVSGAAPDSPTMGLGASRPLVGRVVACWRQDGEGEGGVSVRWYLHSSEIGHLMPETRRDVGEGNTEGEVVQTEKITHHLLPDIIERVAVQHPSAVRHGRPRAPAWFPGWPVYVCGYRYDAAREAVRRIPRAEWAAEHPEALDLFERPVGVGVGLSKTKPPPLARPDRSVVSAAGQALSGVPSKLGDDVVRHFERDPATGEVLWFPALPMHSVARVPPPQHRLEYLAFLAKKYRPELEPPPPPTASTKAEAEPEGAAAVVKQNGVLEGEGEVARNGNGHAGDSMGSDDARGLSMEVDAVPAESAVKEVEVDAGGAGRAADVQMDGTEPPAAKRRKVEERYISASEMIREVLARSIVPEVVD
ncbi:hypothetical protein C8R46DRAFT_1286644 [Mycena filopes]|nr:hypothetical protein C8R46DRAFT_1286644 [Mycena filopes]